MIKELRSVSFVCMANYCRSPVAKMLLKNKYGDSLKIDSAGLRPIVSAGMDPRSIDFLNEKHISYEIHNPKKVDLNLLSSSSVVFAMDIMILMELNKEFKKFRNKIKLFSYQHKSLHIADPYNFPKDKYRDVMEDINFVIENLVF